MTQIALFIIGISIVALAWYFLIPPKNPFPEFKGYTSLWDTLTTSEKWKFRYRFKVSISDIGNSNTIIITAKPLRKQFSLLQGTWSWGNGVCEGIFSANDPLESKRTIWYYTTKAVVGAEASEERRNTDNWSVCKKMEEMRKLTRLLPGKTQQEQWRSMVTLFEFSLFGLYKEDYDKPQTEVINTASVCIVINEDGQHHQLLTYTMDECEYAYIEYIPSASEKGIPTLVSRDI